MGKLHPAAQVFGFKPTAKLLRQLIPRAPIQARQLGIDRARQALAAAGNQRAQFGVSFNVQCSVQCIGC